MRNKRRPLNLLYRLADGFSAALAWSLFFAYRKYFVEKIPFSWSYFDDQQYYLGVLFLPLAWMVLYSLFDKYGDVHRQSRISTIGRTFLFSFFGVVIIYFALLIDDVVYSPMQHLYAFLVLFGLHFVLSALFRVLIITYGKKQLVSGKISYRTLVIGSNENASSLIHELRNEDIGYELIGYIAADGNGASEPIDLPYLGKVADLPSIIKSNEVEEAIIAIETSEHARLREIMNWLFEFGESLKVKITPDMYDILLGSVKMNQVFGTALIDIQQELMPYWQQIIKRTIDVVVSALVLLILSPLYAFIALRVRLSSSGPIFFSQERIGRYGDPFTIYKFRSMFVDAEEDGPQLSKDNDDRCTPWGAVMRKWRLDELPQFWNVLLGDMSLVGPRPERQYYIDQIVERAPHYRHLLKVRPGITSWGQVKYGYASNIDQMLQRLKYDILYIENQSLALDFKIMIYTVLVLLQGKGK